MKNKYLYLVIMLIISTGTWAADADKSLADTAAKSNLAEKSAAKDWAVKPLQHSQAPQVKQAKWVKTPVDAFILVELESKNIKPSPEADRGTYIRRATLDTWGLLPTPAEVEAFEKDKAPDAYEKLADRLLSSPHFGERHARRWLDLARYADSAGFQGDQTRPNNWRYRDYVIASFNEDKPYNQFVREQLAGDELWPDSQTARIATGFLAGYPDNSNSRDLVQRKYQIETDYTDLVGEAFLAQSIGLSLIHI